MGWIAVAAGQQVNQHQNMDQKGNGKGGGKGGKRQHPIKNKQGLFVTTRDGAQVCFRFATGTAQHRARKVVRMCVRDACSLTKTTQRHVRRGGQSDYVSRPHRHRLQVRQTVCLRLLFVFYPSFVELFGNLAGFTQEVADVVQPPGGRCGRRRHLLEARGERPTGAHVVGTRCATAQDVLSGWATKRVGQCRCGWFPCGCSFSFTVERFGHQESPPVALCVSPCVFLLCHCWEAGHQEGARTVPCRHRSCPRCLALPRGSAASLQGRSLLQRRVLNAWRFE